MLVFREKSGFPTLSFRQWIGVTLLGLSGVFAYNLFFFSALQTVEAGRAGVIIATNPVFIALFSYLLFREQFTLQKAAGIVLSVTGAIIVISRGQPGELLSQGAGIGEVYLLGCVASWVIYTLVGKRVLGGLSPLVAVTYSAIIGTLLLLPFAYQQNAFSTLLKAKPTVFIALGYLAFFGTVLGFVWFYQGVKEIGPSRAGVFINLVPVSAVLFGVVLLGETPSLSLLAGGLLVLAGVVLTNRKMPLLARHPAP